VSEKDVHVVIIMFQGLIEDVAAFNKTPDATHFFEQETKVSWPEFEKRIETEDSETVLADYAGSTIYDLKLK